MKDSSLVPLIPISMTVCKRHTTCDVIHEKNRRCPFCEMQTKTRDIDAQISELVRNERRLEMEVSRLKDQIARGSQVNWMHEGF